jgi:molybdate transport system substrate-binding protein
MKMNTLKSSSLLMAASLLMCGSAVQAADLIVWSGNGAKAAVVTLCKQFEQATGNKVAVHFEVNPEVQRKLEGGEAFDVVVGNPPTVDALIKTGKVVPGSGKDFGRSGLAVAVRSGTPKPDVSSVDAFKRALLASKAVAFPGEGASGRYFVSVVERVGLADAMKTKLKPMPANDTVEVVARGEADMVVVVATRLTDVPGIDIVGPIPAEVQTWIGFAAGLSAATKQPEAAKALIAFMSAPSAAATLKAKGVDPL